jgi:ribosomal-protein-alanine N-acetyltransferase
MGSFLMKEHKLPILHTSRTCIRAAGTGDFDRLLPLYRRPENMQYILDGKSDWTKEEIIQKWKLLNRRLEKGIGLRVVEDKKSGCIIGEAGILSLPRSGGRYLEIGFMLDKNWRGRGLATEVVQALLACAFGEMRLRCLRASALARNQASLRLLQKVGFRPLHKDSPLTEQPLLHFELSRDRYMDIYPRFKQSSSQRL